MLTSCIHRPQCAITDNDEGFFVLAVGDDGDDDDGTDAAKARTFTHKRHSHKHIRIALSAFWACCCPETVKTNYDDAPVVIRMA